MNDLQRRQGLLIFGLVESHVLRDEKGVFNLGRVVITSCGKDLDGDSLFQLLETLDPLQSGGGAAVLKHGTQQWNVLLHRGHREVAIEDVATCLSLHCQVVPIVLYPPMAPLLDVNVGCANGDRHYVAVSITRNRINLIQTTVKFVKNVKR